MPVQGRSLNFGSPTVRAVSAAVSRLVLLPADEWDYQRSCAGVGSGSALNALRRIRARWPPPCGGGRQGAKPRGRVRGRVREGARRRPIMPRPLPDPLRPSARRGAGAPRRADARPGDTSPCRGGSSFRSRSGEAMQAMRQLTQIAALQPGREGRRARQGRALPRPRPRPPRAPRPLVLADRGALLGGAKGAREGVVGGR